MAVHKGEVVAKEKNPVSRKPEAAEFYTLKVFVVKKFWEVIYDDDKRTMKIIGSSTNDTFFTNNVSEMQRIGMKVRCQTTDISVPAAEITVQGYSEEKNLYGRLIELYEQKTKKRINRW